MSENLIFQKEIALKAVGMDPTKLLECSYNLRSDKEIVLRAFNLVIEEVIASSNFYKEYYQDPVYCDKAFELYNKVVESAKIILETLYLYLGDNLKQDSDIINIMEAMDCNIEDNKERNIK